MFISVGSYIDGVSEKAMSSGIGAEGDGRPHYGGGWALRWNAHNWLVEHGVRYRLHWMRLQQSNGTMTGSNPREGIWEIEIIDPTRMTDDLLVMFKLKFL